MKEYERFCEEAKVRIDLFFEVDVIMRDYHGHLAAEARRDAETAPETASVEGSSHQTSFLSKFGFTALTSCCTTHEH